MVSPIVAAIISFFFPGIGQVVQGETQKGIIMFVAAIVISIILTYALGTIGNIIYLGFVEIPIFIEVELICKCCKLYF
ncbi:MAG: hypothetical protein Q4Q48_02450 [Methanobrevibacter smithii]|nr:hypothetical protein [Methanobrevibacter smithii]